MANCGLLGKLSLPARGACLLLAVAGPSFLRAQSPGSQVWEKAAGGRMAFDVVSVKRDNDSSGDANSNVDLGPMESYLPTGGLFVASNEPLIRYITFAYKLSPEEVKFDVQPQLPKWANTRVYDISARTTGNPTKNQMRLMMQSLLADRFKLDVHYETKEKQILAITLDKPAKLGPNLRQYRQDGVPCTTETASGTTIEPTTAAGFPVQCGTIVHLAVDNPGVTRMGARALDSAVLADMLGVWDQTDEPVVDQTGLGLVDFIIEFTPQRETKSGMMYDPDAPTFVEALKQQLGLKFESRRASVELMVIDHIQEPKLN